jgi:prolipoprotein diacylglyceryl transferase
LHNFAFQQFEKQPMFPDLSYLFHAIVGSEPDNWLSIFKTFGFFMAVAFLFSASIFHHELRRKAKEGLFSFTMTQQVIGQPASAVDIAINAAVGLLVGGKMGLAWNNFEAFRSDPASAIFSAKMNWPLALAGAALFGGIVWYEAWRKRKPVPEIRQVRVYPHDRISELTIAATVGGILGAKIFDLFDNWESFLQDPIGSLTSGGGLAFYGGLVMGFLAVVAYIRKHNIPFWPTADAVAPALVSGYGIGRIGCQLSGDGDWGIVNNAPKPSWMGFLPDWMWRFRYPHHVINHPFTDPVPSVAIDNCQWDYCMQLSEPVYPTPFYETMMMILIFGLLWILRKRLPIPGMLFMLYVGLIALERYLIETIRVNVQHNVLGMSLTQAEIISILLFLIACTGIYRLGRKTAGAS